MEWLRERPDMDWMDVEEDPGETHCLCSYLEVFGRIIIFIVKAVIDL